MTKTRLVWPLLIGLLVGGWAAAHGLAYRIVVPDAAERRHLLDETGHAYFDPAPLFSLALTLVALGLVCCVVGSRAAPRAPWAFALLPPGVFVVQEHLERLLHDGGLPLTTALDPTFVVGLLLQIPFALAALLVARGLAAFADALTCRRRHSSRNVVRAASGPYGPTAPSALPRIGVLALGHGQRAPPTPLLR